MSGVSSVSQSTNNYTTETEKTKKKVPAPAGSYVGPPAGNPDDAPAGYPAPPPPPLMTQILKAIPQLADPKALKSMTLDDLMVLLTQLQGMVTDAQSKTGLDAIKAGGNQRKEAQQKSIDEQKEAAEKAKEAADAQAKANTADTISEAFGMAFAILSLIFAVAAAIVTGGAAIGLVVGAVMGLASATLQTANTEAKKAGTLPKDAMGNQNEISFTGMAQAVQDSLVSNGSIIRVDADGNAIDAKGNKMTAEQVKDAVAKGAMVRKEDDLDKDVMAIGIVLEIAYAAAAIACGIGGAKNVENYITKGKDIVAKALGPTIDRAGAAADTVEAAGDAATAGAETKFNVDIAEADKAGAVADAFAKFYEKEAKKIAFDMQVSQDVVQHLIDALNDIFSGASESISEYGEAGTTIARNMVAGAQA